MFCNDTTRGAGSDQPDCVPPSGHRGHSADLEKLEGIFLLSLCKAVYLIARKSVKAMK